MLERDYEDWLAELEYWTVEAFEARCDVKADIADRIRKEN